MPGGESFDSPSGIAVDAQSSLSCALARLLPETWFNPGDVLVPQHTLFSHQYLDRELFL